MNAELSNILQQRILLNKIDNALAYYTLTHFHTVWNCHLFILVWKRTSLTATRTAHKEATVIRRLSYALYFIPYEKLVVTCLNFFQQHASLWLSRCNVRHTKREQLSGHRSNRSGYRSCVEIERGKLLWCVTSSKDELPERCMCGTRQDVERHK